jgi:hypothetical protein
MVGSAMAVSKSDKKKAKRKAKLKQLRVRKSLTVQRGQREFLLDEVGWLREMGHYKEALATVQKVLRQTPGNETALRELLMIGEALRRPDLEFEAMDGLQRCNCLPDILRPVYCEHLLQRRRYQDAGRVAREGLALLTRAKIRGKRNLKQFYSGIIDLETRSLQLASVEASIQQILTAPQKKADLMVAVASDAMPAPVPAPAKPTTIIPPVPVTIEIADSNLCAFWSADRPPSPRITTWPWKRTRSVSRKPSTA